MEEEAQHFSMRCDLTFLLLKNNNNNNNNNNDKKKDQNCSIKMGTRRNSFGWRLADFYSTVHRKCCFYFVKIEERERERERVEVEEEVDKKNSLNRRETTAEGKRKIKKKKLKK